MLPSTRVAATDPCATPANKVVAENCLPGSPSSEWDISGSGDASIQGFSSDISVNAGAVVHFKIATDSTQHHLDIYRLGYYGGLGARKVATVVPSATLPQTQPACLQRRHHRAHRLRQLGGSASWTVPPDTVSGIYFAKLIRDDTPAASHIVFVVRDDDGHSDLLFQTSDTTWQAYNQYGGNSLYVDTLGPSSPDETVAPGVRTRSVTTARSPRAATSPEDWVFNAEYPMLRWLEQNGYDVSYFTGIDSDRFGQLLLNHKAFMSVGHDEYWSAAQRANVEAARDAGVNLAFFSGNEIFWKTRWETSIDGSVTPYRTLVSYKETHANAKIDPADPPTWTGTWRDPAVQPAG